MELWTRFLFPSAKGLAIINRIRDLVLLVQLSCFYHLPINEIFSRHRLISRVLFSVETCRLVIIIHVVVLVYLRTVFLAFLASTNVNESSRIPLVPKDLSQSCRDSPSQPRLSSYRLNHQTRSFQSVWYKDRPWLEYSIDNDACYCFYCRHFSITKSNLADAFTTSGFNNWKNALGKTGVLTKHALCQSHVLSTENFTSYKRREQTSSSVVNRLDDARVGQIRKNRERLKKICSTLHLLARQMIGFRGHREDERYTIIQ